MPSELERFDRYRRQVVIKSGPVSYIDTGGPGRPVLFIHGAGTSSYLWRNVIGELAGERRCVALDLPLHGRTPCPPGWEFSLPAFADFIADCCDALELTSIDLVANDTGGAIAQVFAVRHQDRLATLTLTNCEAHDNMPPLALRPAVLAARAGLLARMAPRFMRDIPKARRRFYGMGYRDVSKLPLEIAAAQLTPLFGTPESVRQLQTWTASLNPRDLLAVEPALARMQVPTLIVWGTKDIFFRRKWAYWLRDTIPGATEVVEVEGARLFFPDERAAELTVALRRHWGVNVAG
jgi:pimeloyl-ACP methyl ester carboxylesterase